MVKQKKKLEIQTIVLITVVIIFAGLAVFAVIPSKSPKTDQVSPVNFNYDNEPMIGDAKAPVSIVEFGDMKCPACMNWEKTIFKQLKSDYIDQGKVKFYFFNYPFIAEDSMTAALAGEAIFNQDRQAFWSFYQAIYENQGKESEKWATVDTLVKIAKDHVPGIDYDQLAKDINQKTYQDAVNQDLSSAANAGVTGTPTIFINGKNIEQVFDYKQIKQEIDAVLGGK